MAHRRSYKLSPAARTDLENIWLYTRENWSAVQADRYVGRFTAAFVSLATGTTTGRDASTIRAGYRRLTVGSHFVFYMETKTNISVIRILHRRMDVLSRL